MVSNKAKRHVSLLIRSRENDFVLDAWRTRSQVTTSREIKRTSRYMTSLLLKRQQLLMNALRESAESIPIEDHDSLSKMFVKIMIGNIYTKNPRGIWTLKSIEFFRTW